MRRRVTQAGLTYVLPKTSDGRHADYVPALMLAVSRFGTAAQVQAANAYDRHTQQIDIALGRTWAANPYQKQQTALADMGEMARARSMRIYRQQTCLPETEGEN